MENKLQFIQRIVRDWNLNKVLIADKAGINRYTFKMKLADGNNYSFTPDELDRVINVLQQLAADVTNMRVGK